MPRSGDPHPKPKTQNPANYLSGIPALDMFGVGLRVPGLLGGFWWEGALLGNLGGMPQDSEFQVRQFASKVMFTKDVRIDSRAATQCDTSVFHDTPAARYIITIPFSWGIPILCLHQPHAFETSPTALPSKPLASAAETSPAPANAKGSLLTVV